MNIWGNWMSGRHRLRQSKLKRKKKPNTIRRLSSLQELSSSWKCKHLQRYLASLSTLKASPWMIWCSRSRMLRPDLREGGRWRSFLTVSKQQWKRLGNWSVSKPLNRAQLSKRLSMLSKKQWKPLDQKRIGFRRLWRLLQPIAHSSRCIGTF